ncbi:MAG TPA: ATP-binding protein [bacterium]|jgi:hypothetical protein
MKPGFAQTSSVTRFLAAVSALDERGSPEAGWMLVTGEAGLGKSAAVQWWATQQDAVYIRGKAAVTPHWLLTELVTELRLAPARSNEAMFGQALAAIARDPRPIVIDEVEHTLRDAKVLESVRDLSDLVEVPVILVGMERVQQRIARHLQISSRIAQVVEFLPATLDDVRTCCDTLAEVAVADDLVAEMHRLTGGRLREIINALATVEREARRNKLQTVTLDDLRGKTLAHDWQARKPKVAGAVTARHSGAAGSRRASP